MAKSVAEEIRELHVLTQEGVLTQDEFTEFKKALLKRIREQPVAAAAAPPPRPRPGAAGAAAAAHPPPLLRSAPPPRPAAVPAAGAGRGQAGDADGGPSAAAAGGEDADPAADPEPADQDEEPGVLDEDGAAALVQQSLEELGEASGRRAEHEDYQPEQVPDAASEGAELEDPDEGEQGEGGALAAGCIGQQPRAKKWNLELNWAGPFPEITDHDLERYPLMTAAQMSEQIQRGQPTCGTVLGVLALYVDAHMNTRPSSQLPEVSTMRNPYDEKDAVEQYRKSRLFARVSDETLTVIARLLPRKDEQIQIPPVRTQVAMKICHKGASILHAKTANCHGFFDFPSAMARWPPARDLGAFERISLGLEMSGMIQGDDSLLGPPALGWPTLPIELPQKKIYHRDRVFTVLYSEADIRFGWPRCMCETGSTPCIEISIGCPVTFLAKYNPGGGTHGARPNDCGTVVDVHRQQGSAPRYTVHLLRKGIKQLVKDVPNKVLHNVHLRAPGPAPRGLRMVYPFESGYGRDAVSLMGDAPPITPAGGTPAVLCDLLRINTDQAQCTSGDAVTAVVDPTEGCVRFLSVQGGEGEDVLRLEPRLVRNISVVMSVDDSDEINSHVPAPLRPHVLIMVRHYVPQSRAHTREDLLHGKNWEGSRDIFVGNAARARRLVQALEGLALAAAKGPPAESPDALPPLAQPWGRREIPVSYDFEELPRIDRAYGVPCCPPLLWQCFVTEKKGSDRAPRLTLMQQAQAASGPPLPVPARMERAPQRPAPISVGGMFSPAPLPPRDGSITSFTHPRERPRNQWGQARPAAAAGLPDAKRHRAARGAEQQQYVPPPLHTVRPKGPVPAPGFGGGPVGLPLSRSGGPAGGFPAPLHGGGGGGGGGIPAPTYGGGGGGGIPAPRHGGMGLSFPPPTNALGGGGGGGGGVDDIPPPTHGRGGGGGGDDAVLSDIPAPTSNRGALAPEPSV
eukprot:TRINITY_DN8687_c0_g2_i1.p1 TRINITY_DN8687_c0_g2~~TRINITY_DN8687_c0_g2_i1.p1  ORF type:complete len:966 (+),score=237.31 TRINITY_DN8687_c0_g2_i1:75-2972(+)